MNKIIGDYKFTYSGAMENGVRSLPLGNGEIGANVWLDKSGVLHMLMSRTNAWSELCRLLKTAHLELELEPSPFKDGADFVLDVERGVLTVSAGGAAVDIYVDDAAPCMRFKARAEQPVAARLRFDNYRSEAFDPGNDFSNYFMMGTQSGILESADTVTETPAGGCAQIHRDSASCYEFTLRNQDMEQYIGRERDPLLGWTFGVAAYSPDMRPCECGLAADAVCEFSAGMYSDAMFTDAAEELAVRLDELHARYGDWTAEGQEKHAAAWKAFWDGAYIYATGDDDAERITRAFVYQRYMMRCADRGSATAKFNGSLFVADQMEGHPGNYDARRWGGPYWIQNTRLMYWYLLKMGDYASMKPLLDMCISNMPVSIERVRANFGHAGMLLPETFAFFGLYVNGNYGFANSGDARLGDGGKSCRRGEAANRYIRYHYEGMLELAWMMLRYMELSGDMSRRAEMLDFCRNVLLFFDNHFDKIDGRLVMYPVSALETWQVCVNDAPDIAGLTVICRALRNMDDIPDELAKVVESIYNALPDLPVRMVNGRRKLQPCEIVIDNATRNVENPELYSVFPFDIYGLGKPDIELARDAYADRRFRHDGGWSQDPVQAALLGLTDEAARHMIRETGMVDNRALFPAMWGPNFDETPDQDHGSVVCLCLATMLLQGDADKPIVFPSWPEKWDVSFRLPLTNGKWVRGEQIDGKRRHWME